jgi:hypothetical protein
VFGLRGGPPGQEVGLISVAGFTVSHDTECLHLLSHFAAHQHGKKSTKLSTPPTPGSKEKEPKRKPLRRWMRTAQKYQELNIQGTEKREKDRSRIFYREDTKGTKEDRKRLGSFDSVTLGLFYTTKHEIETRQLRLRGSRLIKILGC